MRYRIRDLREDHDWTQREVAEKLHCSQQVYSNYELGQREIPLNLLIELAKLYHTTVDYLLGLDDDFYRDNTDSDDKNTGENLRKLRLQSGISLEAAAQRLQANGCDISADTLLKIEQGYRRISIRELKCLKQLFQCEYSDILDEALTS